MYEIEIDVDNFHIFSNNFDYFNTIKLYIQQFLLYIVFQK